jgi:hypothetical protein
MSVVEWVVLAVVWFVAVVVVVIALGGLTRRTTKAHPKRRWREVVATGGLSLLTEDEHRETDEERDARFAPENDRIWGPGNWVRCPTCPRDSEGREVYHHVKAHS